MMYDIFKSIHHLFIFTDFCWLDYIIISRHLIAFVFVNLYSLLIYIPQGSSLIIFDIKGTFSKN
jgi:hypothetical protein